MDNRLLLEFYLALCEGIDSLSIGKDGQPFSCESKSGGDDLLQFVILDGYGDGDEDCKLLIVSEVDVDVGVEGSGAEGNRRIHGSIFLQRYNVRRDAKEEWGINKKGRKSDSNVATAAHVVVHCLSCLCGGGTDDA
jgi:hypothetical protein